MPLNVGTVYGTVELRVGGVKRGASEAKSEVDKLKDHMQKRMKELASAFQDAGRTLSIGLTAPIVGLGVASFKAASDMDSLKRGLTAVAGSSQEAEKQLARLREVAKLPGLTLESAIQGSIRLQSVKINADLAERSMKAFGNAIAIVGGGGAEMERVTLALQQMGAKGKVFAEEINQVNEVLPQIRQAMKDAFGTADTERLQKLGITSEEFLKRVTAQLEKLPQVTGGVKNAMENFTDASKQALTAVGDAILPVATAFLDKVTPAIIQAGETFKGLPGIAKTALGGLAIGGAIIGPALYGIGALVDAIGKIGVAFAAVAASPGVAAFKSGVVGLLARAATVLSPSMMAALLALGSEGVAGAAGDDAPNRSTRDKLRYLKFRHQLGVRGELPANENTEEARQQRNAEIARLETQLKLEMQTREGVLRRIQELRKGLASGHLEPGMTRAQMQSEASALDKRFREMPPGLGPARNLTITDKTLSRKLELEAMAMSSSAETRRKAAYSAAQDAYNQAIQDGADPKAAFAKLQADIKAANDDFKQAMQRIKQDRDAVLKSTLNVAGDVAKAIGGGVSNTNKVADEYRQMASGIQDAFRQGFQQAERDGATAATNEPAVKDSFMAILEQYEKVAKQSELFSTFGQNFAQSLQDSLHVAIKTARQANVNEIGQGMLQSLGGISDQLGGTVQSVQDAAKRIGKETKQRFRTEFNFGRELGYNLSTEFGRGFADGFERMLGSFGRNPIGRALSRSLEGLLEHTFDDLFANLGNVLKGKGGGGLSFLGKNQGVGGSILNVLLGGVLGGGLLGSVLGGFGKIFRFADGGRPPVGRFSLVGERGPELVKFDRAATVFPNGVMPTGVDSVPGDNITINVHPSPGMDEYALAKRVERHIADLMYRRGAVRQGSG